MSSNPSDLVAVRTAVMPMIGVTNAAEIGIVGNGAHAGTGGYHEGRDVLTALGIVSSDYSVRDYTRDAMGLTDDASAIDITLAWGAAQGGRVAAIRFSNLMVADLQHGAPGSQCIRAINWSPDGVAKRRIDRHNGLAISISTDNVDIHTHIETFRDTAGTRDGAFLGLIKKNILIAQGQLAQGGRRVTLIMAHEHGSNVDWVGDGIHRFQCPDANHRANILAVMEMMGDPNPVSREFTPGTLDALGPVIVQYGAAGTVTLTDAQITSLAAQVIAGLPAELGATPAEVDSIVRGVFRSVPA